MSRKKLTGRSTKLAVSSVSDEITNADISQNVDGAMRNIGVDIIKNNPHQPRQHFDPEKMAELTQSVRDSGVIQPIIVRFEDQDIYLVAGERRLRAARAAGLGKIPAILTEGDPAHIALIENIQRENLKPVQEAEAMIRLMDERGYTQEQLAKIVGKAKSTVSEVLSLNRLPDEIKDEVRRVEYYPKRMLIEVVKQKTPDRMLTLFKRIKEADMTSDEVKQITRKEKRKGVTSPRRTTIAIASKKASELTSYIRNKIRVSRLTAEERYSFLEDMRKLREAMDHCEEKIQAAEHHP
jgi:ParB family chromosome partitioning protein